MIKYSHKLLDEFVPIKMCNVKPVCHVSHCFD
jgi:hypothetical protein